MGSIVCTERSNDCESSYYDFIPNQKNDIVVKFYASDMYYKKIKRRKRKRAKINTFQK